MRIIVVLVLLCVARIGATEVLTVDFTYEELSTHSNIDWTATDGTFYPGYINPQVNRLCRSSTPVELNVNIDNQSGAQKDYNIVVNALATSADVGIDSMVKTVSTSRNAGASFATSWTGSQWVYVRAETDNPRETPSTILTTFRVRLEGASDGELYGYRDITLTGDNTGVNGLSPSTWVVEFEDTGTTVPDPDEVSSAETVPYSFTVNNQSDVIFLITIFEDVDGTDVARDTFSSQPGEFTYEGTIEVFPETTSTPNVLGHVSGIGPGYVYNDESGADWVASWEITPDTLPTVETAVGFTSVGTHDGILTVVDNATGETLQIVDLSDGKPLKWEQAYDSSAVDLSLSGSTGTLTDLGNGNWVINPTADGTPTVSTKNLGTWTDSDGNVHQYDESTVSSGGTDYQFGPGGENYQDDDETLERIDMETRSGVSGFDPDARGQDVDDLIEEGKLDLEGKKDDAIEAIDGDGDGEFDLIPVPEDWYAGLAVATEWRVDLPDWGILDGVSTPDMVVDLTHPAFGAMRQIVAICFAIMLTFSAFRFARV
jgi:hypothetical protein